MDNRIKSTALDEESERIWESLVEEGRKARAGVIEEKARVHEENLGKLMAGRKRADDPSKWRRRKKAAYSDGEYVIPDSVRMFVVARASGLSFREAGAMSGAKWIDVTMAKAKSEEMRCAVEGMEAASRFLIRMKAESVVEQSQDEGARVSFAQVQIAESMLKRLDSEHYGDDVGKKAVAEEVRKELGNGGFVVNLIADAARVAGEAPAERPKKALVYSDV